MKVICLSNAKDIKQLSMALVGHQGIVVEKIEQVIPHLGKEKVIVLYDDSLKSPTVDVIASDLFIYRAKVKFIYVTGDKGAKEFRVIQNRLGDNAPDHFFTKPLSAEAMFEVIKDYAGPPPKAVQTAKAAQEEMAFNEDLSFVGFDKSKYLRGVKEQIAKEESPTKLTKEADLKQEISKEIAKSVKVEESNNATTTIVQQKVNEVFKEIDKAPATPKPSSEDVTGIIESARAAKSAEVNTPSQLSVIENLKDKGTSSLIEKAKLPEGFEVSSRDADDEDIKVERTSMLVGFDGEDDLSEEEIGKTIVDRIELAPVGEPVKPPVNMPELPKDLPMAPIPETQIIETKVISPKESMEPPFVPPIPDVPELSLEQSEVIEAVSEEVQEIIEEMPDLQFDVVSSNKTAQKEVIVEERSTDSEEEINLDFTAQKVLPIKKETPVSTEAPILKGVEVVEDSGVYGDDGSGSFEKIDKEPSFNKTAQTVISKILPEPFFEKPSTPKVVDEKSIQLAEEISRHFDEVDETEDHSDKTMAISKASVKAIRELKEVKEEESGHTRTGQVTKSKLLDDEVRKNESRPKVIRSIEELEAEKSALRHLRYEREELLKEIEHLHEDKRTSDHEKIELRALTEDLNIELTIIKKRFEQEREELKKEVRDATEKSAIYEEKVKNYQKEFDKLSSKLRVDHNAVKRRESELLEQLELVKHDSEIQIKSRDMKILELKRKIDALEFNMENISSAEVRVKEDKHRIEDRLEKVIKTLRSSIKMLESDRDVESKEAMDRLKKL